MGYKEPTWSVDVYVVHVHIRFTNGATRVRTAAVFSSYVPLVEWVTSCTMKFRETTPEKYVGDIIVYRRTLTENVNVSSQVEIEYIKIGGEQNEQEQHNSE